MSFSQVNTTNPHHIKRIAKHRIGLVVNRDDEGRAITFAVNSLSLDDYNLPDEARIKLFAYSKTREQSTDLGTIAKPRLGLIHRFEIDTGSPFHFRFIVCEQGRPDIIASCEGLRATEDTEEGGLQHLLPVEPSDNLEEKLWELRFDGDGDPVLYLNSDSEIGMLALMREDPIFQALILPQIVEQVVYQLSQYREDNQGWKGKWNTYLNSLNIEAPDDPDDEDSCAGWARDVAQKFSNKHKFLTQARMQILKGSYGN